MTYSQQVKAELCEAKFSCQMCNVAFVYAMLLFRHTDEPGVLFQTDNKEIIDLLAQKIVEITGVIAATDDGGRQERKKHRVYRLSVEATDDVAEFYRMFEKALRFRFDVSAFRKNCCKSAFLRGVFLACGVLVNPEKEYHFEFKLHNSVLADALYEELLATGLPFKRTTRKGNAVIYLKGSEPIEEVLTFMGASKNALELMNIKIMKEVRNKVNRVTNCETANIGKTVKASMKQVEDIRYILQHKGEAYLSDDLQEAAQIRLAYPEMSLSELCREVPSGISRSGLNHRLNKLSKIAEELRREEANTESG